MVSTDDAASPPPPLVRQFHRAFDDLPLPADVQARYRPPGRWIAGAMVDWIEDHVPYHVRQAAVRRLADEADADADEAMVRFLQTGDWRPRCTDYRTTWDDAAAADDGRPWWPHHIGSAVPLGGSLLGLKVRVLRPGALLFHGTSAEVTPDDVLSRGNFFADEWMATNLFAQDYAEHLGSARVLRFRVVSPTGVRLLALDDGASLGALRHRLRRDGAHELARRLELAFPFVDPGTGRVTRHYGSANDVPLCLGLGRLQLGVDGFMVAPVTMDRSEYGRELFDPNGGGGDAVVPPELFLCEPRAFLAEAPPHQTLLRTQS